MNALTPDPIAQIVFWIALVVGAGIFIPFLRPVLLFPLTLLWRIVVPLFSSLDEVAVYVWRAHRVVIRHFLPRNVAMPNVIRETTTMRHG
jgi:hypothetical protein